MDIIKLNDTAGQVEKQFNSDNLKNILQYCSRQGLYSQVHKGYTDCSNKYPSKNIVAL